MISPENRLPLFGIIGWSRISDTGVNRDAELSFTVGRYS